MAASSKHRLSSDINVVPYIDVMLVLLVIFMVTAPLLNQGVQVNLPKADAEPLDPSLEEPLIVSIKPDGSLYLNVGEDQKKALPLSELQETVRKIVVTAPDTAVMVWGDHSVPYGEVVLLMTQLEQVGVEQVGLITEPLQ